jgi:LAO/AO transport system kinase
MRRQRPNPEQLAELISQGDRYALSRAITLIESSLPQDQKLAEVLLTLLPARNSKRIGISGPPGVGKSSFIETFGLYLVSQGISLAVLAIDPSSPLAKGSILGDKTRMEALSQQPSVYIRPSASGGHLGGVAQKTRQSIRLCEAAGFEVVMVETVGVGQSEVEVRSMVDFFLLLVQAGGGDEVQGIKKGIVEMADLIAVTKADGSLLDKAQTTALEYQNALHYYPKRAWNTQVMLCSALQNSGINEIWQEICRYYASVPVEVMRNEQNVEWMHRCLENKLKEILYQNPDIKLSLGDTEELVRAGLISAEAASERLLDLLIQNIRLSG